MTTNNVWVVELGSTTHTVLVFTAAFDLLQTKILPCPSYSAGSVCAVCIGCGAVEGDGVVQGVWMWGVMCHLVCRRSKTVVQKKTVWVVEPSVTTHTVFFFTTAFDHLQTK